MITVPYSTAFNIPKYSILATVKVMGYYTGPCASNLILTRGKTGTGTGNYNMYFTSFAADSSCSIYDTTKETFFTITEARPQIGYAAGWAYTPYVSNNEWYRVVGTFDDTTLKIYINGALKVTRYLVTPGIPISSSTDSISIGFNVFESSYPYPFNGVIDDIQLYSRAITDSEVQVYSDTCGPITQQPVASHLVAGGNTLYTVTTSMSFPSFQWQVNTGSGFTNLSNSTPYSGVTNDTLTITGMTIAMNSYQYRCMVSNLGGCRDTSSSALLTTGLADVDLDALASVFPNPAGSSISITVDPSLGGGTIQLFNEVGQLVAEKVARDVKTYISLSDIPSGLYIVRIQKGDIILHKTISRL